MPINRLFSRLPRTIIRAVGDGCILFTPNGGQPIEFNCIQERKTDDDFFNDDVTVRSDFLIISIETCDYDQSTLDGFWTYDDVDYVEHDHRNLGEGMTELYLHKGETP